MRGLMAWGLLLLGSCGADPRSPVAPVNLDKQWAAMSDRRISQEEHAQVTKHLEREEALAIQLARKAQESPDQVTSPSSPRIIQSASLQFLTLFPDIVRAKRIALDRGDYRLAMPGALPLSILVCDDNPRFALVWGQYLKSAPDGYADVVFRLSEADYRETFDMMRALRDERASPDYKGAAQETLDTLAPRRQHAADASK